MVNCICEHHLTQFTQQTVWDEIKIILHQWSSTGRMQPGCWLSKVYQWTQVRTKNAAVLINAWGRDFILIQAIRLIYPGQSPSSFNCSFVYILGNRTILEHDYLPYVRHFIRHPIFIVCVHSRTSCNLTTSSGKCSNVSQQKPSKFDQACL